MCVRNTVPTERCSTQKETGHPSQARVNCHSFFPKTNKTPRMTEARRANAPYRNNTSQKLEPPSAFCAPLCSVKAETKRRWGYSLIQLGGSRQLRETSEEQPCSRTPDWTSCLDSTAVCPQKTESRKCPLLRGFLTSPHVNSLAHWHWPGSH